MSAHQCLRTDKREWQTATVRPSFGTETTARTESDFEKQQLKSEDIFYSPVKISPSSICTHSTCQAVTSQLSLVQPSLTYRIYTQWTFGTAVDVKGAIQFYAG
jgi:hypothetical protein